jgi:uncharacterized Zn finger protein
MTITCNHCGEELNISMMQRNEDEIRYRCGCGLDISIDKYDAEKVKVMDWLKENKKELFEQIVNEYFDIE